MPQHFFLALSIFVKFLKMAPTPNFGVFSDFVHPFLSEVDFNIIELPKVFSNVFSIFIKQKQRALSLNVFEYCSQYAVNDLELPQF